MTPNRCTLTHDRNTHPLWSQQVHPVLCYQWRNTSSSTRQCSINVRLQWAIRRQKVRADRHRSEAPVSAPGARVWLSLRNLPLRLPCRKLRPRIVGPFKVLRRLNDVIGYSFPLITVLTPRSMCFSSGRWWLVHSSSLRCGRFLGPLWTSRGSRHILCEPSWTQGGRRGAFSTSWSGRGMVWSRDAGCRWRTSIRWRTFLTAGISPSPPGSPCASSSISSPRPVSARCWSCASRGGGGYCHNFHRSWCLSLFGRSSAVVVPGFLAATDLHFHLFCLDCTHLVPIMLIFIPYLTRCFPHGFVRVCSLFSVQDFCELVCFPCVEIFCFFSSKVFILLSSVPCT